MKKSDLLQPAIEDTLNEVNFIDRYRKISQEFAEFDGSFQYSSEELLLSLRELGIEAKQFPGEQYFSVFEPTGDFQCRIGLTIKENIIEFDITIRSEEQGVNSGGSWGLIVQLMTNWEENIKTPGFRNRDELQSVLKEAVALYVDVKNHLSGGGSSSAGISDAVHISSEVELDRALEVLILKLKNGNNNSYKFFQEIQHDLRSNDVEEARARLRNCFSITQYANFNKEQSDLLSKAISLAG